MDLIRGQNLDSIDINKITEELVKHGADLVPKNIVADMENAIKTRLS